jgi:hypothetical protein
MTHFTIQKIARSSSTSGFSRVGRLLSFCSVDKTFINVYLQFVELINSYYMHTSVWRVMGMSTQTAKVCLKLGHLEVEYEGESSFLEEGIFNLLNRVADFYKENGKAIPTNNSGLYESKSVSTSAKSDIDFSTTTIAAHLKAETGTELAIAAAAHLTFVKSKDKFTRKELLDEMQEAPTYYKTSYSSNLTKTLESLIKSKRFHQNGKDMYALAPQERQSLEAKLA